MSPHTTADQLALACSGARLILLDVRRIGARVRFDGATAASNAGRPVSIRLKSADSIVARATVQADGSFVARAELPPRDIRKTNRARYRAELGGAVSPFLKLARRMRVVGLDTRAGRITIAGKITLPLAKPVATIRVRQRTGCAGAGSGRRAREARPSTAGFG